MARASTTGKMPAAKTPAAKKVAKTPAAKKVAKTPAAKKVAKTSAAKKVATSPGAKVTGTTRVARKIAGTKSAVTEAPRPLDARKVAAAGKLAARSAAKEAPTSSAPGLDAIYATLRAMLLRCTKGLPIKTDTAQTVYVIGHRPYQKKELFVGAVRLGKGYVSYYLFAIYMNRGLLRGMSPALAGRLAGKSCFTFKKTDPDVLAELEALTMSGRRDFEAKGLI